jgi:hypothetical protein
MRSLAVATLVLALPCHAAETKGAVTVAQGGAIEIAAPPCDALVPPAAYVPGVDAAGKPVAPADLPRTPSPIGAGTISIEIDASLAGKFGIPQPGGAYFPKGTVGYVTVQDGRVLFNGKPLGGDASAAVTAACQAAHK